MWNDKYTKKEEPKDAPAIMLADKVSEEDIKKIVDKLLEGQMNRPIYVADAEPGIITPAIAEEKPEEVQEEIQEVGGFGLEMKVTRKGNEMLFTGLNYEAEKPAKKAEEPEVVQTVAPAVVKPAEAQEDASVKAEETEPIPCPFCGAMVKLTYYKMWRVTGHDIHCFLSPNFNVEKTKDQVLAAWNSRSCW